MVELGLKNYRRFQKLMPLKLGGVSFFVGENNAGKSSFSKALMLTLNNLHNKMRPNEYMRVIPEYLFYFEADNMHNFSSTFFRELNQCAKNEIIEFKINAEDDFIFYPEKSGETTKRHVDFTIAIGVAKGENEEQSSGKVNYVTIMDNVRHIELCFNHMRSTVKFSDSNRQDISWATCMDNPNMNYIVNLVYTLICYSDNQTVRERRDLLEGLCSDLSALIDSMSFEYIYSHSVFPHVCYLAEDKNDYMARTIHEFCRAEIDKNSEAALFVRKWMRIFKIGEDFEIEPYAGVLYRFYIIEGGKKMDLAEKGMGTAQLMTLLLRLGYDIHKYNGYHAKPIIIIEEPEQNLHPALQGQLADLFVQLNEVYGFKIIIETHSEYMIREAQVIVAENYCSEESLSDCPLKVFYFPKEGDPYDMVFQSDGRFVKMFGSGFFNVAALSAIKLNKLEGR